MSARRPALSSSKRSPSLSSRFLHLLRMVLTCSAASGSIVIFFRPAVGKRMGSAAAAASQPSAAAAKKARRPSMLAEMLGP